MSGFEGGAWGRSKDPVDITTCLTETRADWAETNGCVDWIGWWDGVDPRKVWIGGIDLCDFSAYSDWDLDDRNSSITWPNCTVQHEFVADYINWTWNCDWLDTTAHHEVGIIGEPDGSMWWRSQGSHGGEDAGHLSFSGGYYDDGP